MEAPKNNPYVGPRSFETGEALFGRTREANELKCLLISERIVLLHSPSGAGKSSLVRASLIPELSARFDVWVPTRVNQEAPPGTLNRYAWSAACGFEQELPEERRRGDDYLRSLTMKEYVNARPRRQQAPESIVLIFDQFEEVLRVDPLDTKAKREFFGQLGDLLMAPNIWALFVLRDDYLAALDPYSSQLPTHLKNRYRIDLLSLEAAREAILKPAPTGGREFTPDAVDKLLHDLAQVKVQQLDGKFQQQTGVNVEPLQLQVVCRGLWDRMPADATTITAAEVDRYGNVTEALSAYYATEVARVSKGDLKVERAVRDWIQKLITADGIRGQMRKTAEKSEGLDNALIASLVDAFLVRAEPRAGATWFELSHDRLVEPVRADNAEWRESKLTLLQKRAALWVSEGRPPHMLLLERPEKELKLSLSSDALEGNEKEFVEASLKVQVEDADRRRQEARLRFSAKVAAGFAVLALAGLSYGLYEKSNALIALDENKKLTEKDLTKRVEAAETQRKAVENNNALLESFAIKEQARKPDGMGDAIPQNFPVPTFRKIAPTLQDKGQIYIDVRDNFGLVMATQQVTNLQKAGYNVAAIVKLPFGPDHLNVRYFHKPDDDEHAQEITNTIGAGSPNPYYISRFEKADNVPKGHFELWYGAEPDVAANLRPPAGNSLLFSARRRGGGGYSCEAMAGGSSDWITTGKEQLVNDKGEVTGAETPGPAWLFLDNSTVSGAQVVQVADQGKELAPWLLLKVGANSANVTYIQRLAVLVNGAHPSPAGCAKGWIFYYFYGAKPASAP